MYFLLYFISTHHHYQHIICSIFSDQWHGRLNQGTSQSQTSMKPKHVRLPPRLSCLISPCLLLLWPDRATTSVIIKTFGQVNSRVDKAYNINRSTQGNSMCHACHLLLTNKQYSKKLSAHPKQPNNHSYSHQRYTPKSISTPCESARFFGGCLEQKTEAYQNTRCVRLISPCLMLLLWQTPWYFSNTHRRPISQNQSLDFETIYNLMAFTYLVKAIFEKTSNTISRSNISLVPWLNIVVFYFCNNFICLQLSTYL